MWIISRCWSPTPLGYGSCLTLLKHTSSPRVTIPKLVAEVGLGQTVLAYIGGLKNSGDAEPQPLGKYAPLSPCHILTCVSQLRAAFVDAACILVSVATSSFHPRGQSITVHAALQSLGRQRWTRYQRHSVTMNSLPCHFVASWRLNVILELIVLISELVTVFTIRVGEHNFNVIIIIT